jgi:hypothetical protein
MAEDTGRGPAGRPVLLPDAPDVVVADPDLRRDPFDPRIQHRYRLVERYAFSVAVCDGCGWESFARRSRPLARSEGRDHVLLYGSGPLV